MKWGSGRASERARERERERERGKNKKQAEMDRQRHTERVNVPSSTQDEPTQFQNIQLKTISADSTQSKIYNSAFRAITTGIIGPTPKPINRQ